MNLDPQRWGPHYWATLHFMASAYDKKPNSSVQLAMKNFIQSLPQFLPCDTCQDHAFDYIKKASLDQVIQNRQTLFTFFFDFHNSVNARLNKPLMKFEDAEALYSTSHVETNWMHSLVGLSIGIIILLFFFVMKKNH